jgi:hypothetical protein
MYLVLKGYPSDVRQPNWTTNTESNLIRQSTGIGFRALISKIAGQTFSAAHPPTQAAGNDTGARPLLVPMLFLD